MKLTQLQLTEIKALHDKGLHLQAFNHGISIAPIAEWEGTDARMMASHLVFQFGLTKLSDRWSHQAWRKDKTHAKALFYRAAEISQSKGPIPGLLFIKKYGDLFKSDAKHTAWWYSLHSQIFASLRDFETAERWHLRAVEADPGESWVWAAKSFLLEQSDRYDEALEYARKALQISPGQRINISQVAHLLTLGERYDEALSLLGEASSKFENAHIIRQFADLQTEMGMHADAFESLNRISKLVPMREKEFESWHYSAMSDAAYEIGNLDLAVEYADYSQTPFHLKIKDRLQARTGTERRKLLKLSFVRQHHVTCAPATLSTIARFWSKKAEHLELANEMCYDGTPGYRERIWALENGWQAREFSVNWDDAVKLIDLGIPFTLATIHPGNGHLQAVVGYDECRKTLLVRDPFFQRIVEFSAEELLKNQESNGPRGLALVPIENEELLNSLELFESDIYDLHFQVESAIYRNNRGLAKEALENLLREFPDHRLTLSAGWNLAAYDGNMPKLLETIKGLLVKFPDDVNLKMSYIGVSNEFTTRAERLETLEKYALGKTGDPLLWQMLGEELKANAKSHTRALHWLWKSLRSRPDNANTLRTIADILWTKRDFEDAHQLYRFAASLQDRSEEFAYPYYLSSVPLKREEEALQFLRDRFQRFGEQSNLPIRSLYYALSRSSRNTEAFEQLTASLRKRPNDAEVKLFAAEAKARVGEIEAAKSLIAECEAEAPRQYWLRTSALIAQIEGDFTSALNHWQEVLRTEPSSADAHESIAFLLTAREGEAAAQSHLRKASREFKYNRGILRLRLSYLSDQTSEAIAVLRDLIKLNPSDAWCHRELVIWLGKVGKLEKALESAQNAVETDPSDPYSWYFLGLSQTKLGDLKQAAESFRKALSLSIDIAEAIYGWIRNCRTKDEKLEVLKYVRDELRSQVSFGDGLFAYRFAARPLIDSARLLGELRGLYAEKAGSWFAASAIVEQLVDMQKFDEALLLAKENVKDFPLVFQVWDDIALVYKFKNDVSNEIQALRRSLLINQNSSLAYQRLCDALERNRNYEESEVVIRDAVSRLPFDPHVRGYYAEVLWKQDKKDEALAILKKAISLQPDYDWAWHVLQKWGAETGNPKLAREIAEQQTQRKPKDARVWLRYSEILENDNEVEPRIEAIEKGLALDPQNSHGLALKAIFLSDRRLYDEAIEVCKTPLENAKTEQLQFVESGVELARGNQKRAISILEELTKKSPEYSPAWIRLANIFADLPDAEKDYLRIAKEIVRHSPHLESSYGILGEAYLKNGQREEAKTAFQQSIYLAPDYVFGASMLFDLCFEDDEKEDCRKALKHLEDFIKGEPTVTRKIAFHSKYDELESALKVWKELCFDSEATKDGFLYSIYHLNSSKAADPNKIWSLVRDYCRDESVNPILGELLLEKEWNSNGLKNCQDLMIEFEANRKLWNRSAICFMGLLLPAHQRSLTKFIDRNESDLKSDVNLWGHVGYCLNGVAEYKRAEAWFADWKQRDGVASWMLWNYSMVLRNQKKGDEAGRINRVACDLNNDQTVNSHMTILAMDELIAGNIPQSESLISRVNPGELSAWDMHIYQMLEFNHKAIKLLQNGEIDEAEESIRNLIDTFFPMEGFWKDVILSEFLTKTVKKLLPQHRLNWQKVLLRIRMFAANIFF